MFFKAVKILCISAFLASGIAQASERVERGDVILFKSGSDSSIKKLVVIIPGGTKAPEEYETLARRISSQPSVQMWTAVVRFAQNMPNPLTISSRISSAAEFAVEQGFPEATAANAFIVGHSLGGIVAQNYLKNNSASGLILLGSYLTRSGTDVSGPVTFSVPVLTIGAELDGQTRLTRIAQELDAYRGAGTRSGVNEALRLRPVTIVRGANHAAFANGQPMKGDMQAEAPYDVSQENIASMISGFVGINSVNDEAAVGFRKQMRDYVSDAELITVGYRATRQFSDNWCPIAQVEVGGGFEDLKVSQTVFPSLQSFVFSKPQASLKDGVPEVIVSTKFDRVTNRFDVSTNPEESNVIACKMKNSLGLAKAFEREVQDKYPKTCQELNKLAWLQVLEFISPTARERFASRGRPLNFVSDKALESGVSWVSADVSVAPSADGRSYDVSSPSLYTDLSAPDRFEGMLYCKLYSPARMAEWILVDGLR